MVVGLFDADHLAGEDRAEIDLALLATDAATACDGDGLVVKRIIELVQVFVDARGPFSDDASIPKSIIPNASGPNSPADPQNAYGKSATL